MPGFAAAAMLRGSNPVSMSQSSGAAGCRAQCNRTGQGLRQGAARIQGTRAPGIKCQGAAETGSPLRREAQSYCLLVLVFFCSTFAFWVQGR